VNRYGNNFFALLFQKIVTKLSEVWFETGIQDSEIRKNVSKIHNTAVQHGTLLLRSVSILANLLARQRYFAVLYGTFLEIET
jgi:hypothetical protein